MADGITINYEFVQPEVGASQDTWGGKLNDNWAALDALLKSAEDAIAARIEIDNIAVASDLRAGTAGKVLDGASIYTGNAPVTSSGSGVWEPDFSTARNFTRVLNGDSTVANPTNQVPGQSGLIILKQDATGGRTVSFGTNWKLPSGEVGIAAAPASISVLSYFVSESGEVLATITGGLV